MGKKASNRTKQCRTRKNIFGLLHFLCLFGPLLYFVPYGFITGETVQKIAMGFSVIVSLILAVFTVIVDVKHRAGLHRTIMWILIAAVLFALQEIKAFIWIMAVTSIIDELVFTRLRDYYRTALISNKEIDRRTP